MMENFRKKASGESFEKTKALIREITVVQQMVQTSEISIQAPPFLTPLGWVLKQLRDMFILQWEA
jgi:hypothetical protein